MCGHGTIGTITIALEEGLIVPKTTGTIKMEAPAGLVNITYKQDGKKVNSVKLTNVPAFLDKAGISAECPELGELVIDVSDHRERVSARDEVLLDHDCGFAACAFETAGAALEHHVSGRDSGGKVHRTILDNCGQTIAVGSYIRNFAGRMRDVRVVGVGQEQNPAAAGEQSEVSSVT